MLITFLFDSGYSWCVNALLAFLLVNFTAMPFLSVFTAIQICSAIKFAIGILLVRSGFWVRRLVGSEG